MVFNIGSEKIQQAPLRIEGLTVEALLGKAFGNGKGRLDPSFALESKIGTRRALKEIEESLARISRQKNVIKDVRDRIPAGGSSTACG